MSNPSTHSYRALTTRVQHAALLVTGVAWTFPTLVQPVHAGGTWFWVSTGLATATTVFGVSSMLETRFWRVPILAILLACIWRGGLRSLETTLLHRQAETGSEEGDRNRANLQNSLRTLVFFALTAGVSVAAIMVDAPKP